LSRGVQLALSCALLCAGLALPAQAGDPTVLPPGTVFGEERVRQPREILHDEADGGRQSDLVALGNMAFASPLIFGDPARKAGLTCETCHNQGDVNQVFFIPGLSDRPGGVAVVNALFNTETTNGLHRHIDIPSLRGIRYLAPYGRDGRIAALRDFTRNVIVNEFAGPEPSPKLVDAITAYMEQIDFLPNPKLASDGQLTDAADPAARRGEMLFNRNFPQMGNQSCAGCHHPSALFVDHLQHDIGTGGAFKTQTLLNADFTAPYFHDGRYATFGQVVDYFDGTYKLGLPVADKSDLVAYLQAVGEGEQPFENNTPDRELDELLVFSRPLERAIAERDMPVVDLAVGTMAHEMRELQERFPGPSDPLGAGEQALLKPARSAAAGLVIQLRRVQSAAQAGRYEEAMAALKTFRNQADAARPVFPAALPVSLYDPTLAAQHQALVAELTPPATQPTPLATPLATAGSHANP
jgi:cytochrome c peroxidase